MLVGVAVAARDTDGIRGVPLLAKLGPFELEETGLAGELTIFVDCGGKMVLSILGLFGTRPALTGEDCGYMLPEGECSGIEGLGPKPPIALVGRMCSKLGGRRMLIDVPGRTPGGGGGIIDGCELELVGRSFPKFPGNCCCGDC